MNSVVTSQSRAAVQVTSPAQQMQVLLEMARDPNLNQDAFKMLMAEMKEAKQQKARERFNMAMAKAQADMSAVQVWTNAKNDHTKSNYATYAQIDKAVRPVYTKHGFGISYDEADSPKAGCVRVVAIVSHRDGFERHYHTDMPIPTTGARGGAVMTDTQGTGAAKQYGMRYLLRGIFNIAIGDEDKDGNADDPKLATISEKQIADIKALLTEVGSTVPKFLNAMGLRELSEILAVNYSSVVAMIERKRGQGVVR